MSLTNEDLQAIRALIQEELKPLNKRLDSVEASLHIAKSSKTENPVNRISALENAFRTQRSGAPTIDGITWTL